MLPTCRICGCSTQLLKNKAWIAGQWCDAVSDNPSNQQLIAEVCSSDISVSLIATLSAPHMGEEDVTVAVQEAYTAQKGWAAHTAKVTIALRNVYSFTAASLWQERSGVLRRWYNLIMQNMAKIVLVECVSACPAPHSILWRKPY